MEISKIRPYEGYYDNSIGRVTGNSGSDQISNPIENFSTGKMQSVKPEQKQTFGAAEYADTYQPGKEYPLKGVDSDIRSLRRTQCIRRDSKTGSSNAGNRRFFVQINRTEIWKRILRIFFFF